MRWRPRGTWVAQADPRGRARQPKQHEGRKFLPLNPRAPRASGRERALACASSLAVEQTECAAASSRIAPAPSIHLVRSVIWRAVLLPRFFACSGLA